MVISYHDSTTHAVAKAVQRAHSAPVVVVDDSDVSFGTITSSYLLGADIVRPALNPIPPEVFSRMCPKCHGTKFINSKFCWRCRGAGIV